MAEGSGQWHLYVLRRADGALYTGISTDVQRRLAEHAAGTARGARSLRARGPFTLVYCVRLGARSLASRAEQRLKARRKCAKEALVLAWPDAPTLLRTLGLDG